GRSHPARSGSGRLARRRPAVPAPARPGRGEHAHGEPEPAPPGQAGWDPGAPKQPRRAEQGPPDPWLAARAQDRAGEGREPAGPEQFLPRRLEPPPVAHPRGTDGLAPPAAEAGVEVL